jgi:hypothetical protein
MKEKRKITIYKALHRKLKIMQHKLHNKPGVKSGARGRLPVSTPLIAPQ